MPARTLFASVTPAEHQRAASDSGPRIRSWRREPAQEKAARANRIAERLAGLYPGIECPLKHRNVFELLIAVILSAQCTDAAVNKVTPALFDRYPSPAELARAAPAAIEPYIRSLGLYRAKAKALKNCARQLMDEFGGEVPSSMEDLTRLAGVGRKTANVVRGHGFGIPGIAVDTHCKRLSQRLGLTRHADPAKIEDDLAKILRPEQWTPFSHRLILHGRALCHARNPACSHCALLPLCPTGAIGKNRKPTGA